MMPRNFLGWIAGLVLCFGVANLSLAEEKPLNVLFLISDDLRPELGCYGNEIIKSPNIDRLAERGMVFNRAYCQQAVCSPSRTSVMTGVRPDTSKVWDLKTHFREELPNVVTLSQHFKNHGYTAKRFGKIYHGTTLADPFSWSSEAEAGEVDSIKSSAETNAKGSGSASKNSRKQKASASKPKVSKEKLDALIRKVAEAKKIKPDRSGRGPAFRATSGGPNEGSDGESANSAISELQNYKESGEPFFLAVGFRKPHLPFSVPKMYWDLYDPQEIPLAENSFLPEGSPEYALASKNEMWSYRDVPDTDSLPEPYARQVKHGYYAAVSYMDTQLGRVLDELDRLELTDNTIVVLWGDHGWKLGEHDRWSKHSNCEDDARSPLIISVPGMKNIGTKTDALVEFVDIYPTLTELANLPMPKHLEGTSMAPLLENPEISWKSATFSQYPRYHNNVKYMGVSMKTDRYRFTRWSDRTDYSKVYSYELYDHQSDPQENKNVADDPANAELVAELSAQLEAGWQAAKPKVVVNQ